MPELPEVETVVRHLKQSEILHVPINEVIIRWNKTFPYSENELIHTCFTDIVRHGKYIVFTLSNGKFLLCHLRMSGMFFIKNRASPILKHEHLVINFQNDISLRFHDTRKFGRFEISKNYLETLQHIGPDPLKISYSNFFEKIKLEKKALKSLLLDQRFLAGLGNIYVDESLWKAKLHPKTFAHQITQPQIKALYKAIQESLHKGITSGGTSLGEGMGNFHSINGQSGKNQQQLHAYGRQNLPCDHCGNLIKKITFTQRGTHFCPSCQEEKIP